MKLNSIKTQLIIFLSAFALFICIRDRDTAFLLAICLSVIFASAIEGAFLFLKNKKFSLSESAIISGLIIGFVLSSDQHWWIFFFAALLAIGSKYFIRFNERHIFNPAAFGIFMTIIILGAQTQWSGTYLWIILAPFGIYFSAKIKKIEILCGYFLASVILFGAQALIQKVGFLNIFAYFSYFYIFIMMVEPKTTPFSRLGKYLFGIGVALVIFILTNIGVRFDVELCSLLALNLTVSYLNNMSKRKELKK